MDGPRSYCFLAKLVGLLSDEGFLHFLSIKYLHIAWYLQITFEPTVFGGSPSEEKTSHLTDKEISLF